MMTSSTDCMPNKGDHIFILAAQVQNPNVHYCRDEWSTHTTNTTFTNSVALRGGRRLTVGTMAGLLSVLCGLIVGIMSAYSIMSVLVFGITSIPANSLEG